MYGVAGILLTMHIIAIPLFFVKRSIMVVYCWSLSLIDILAFIYEKFAILFYLVCG